MGERKIKYRYSVNIGEYGGIVIAFNKEDAIDKLSYRYNKLLRNDPYKPMFRIWEWKDDEYFDKTNPDVIECYGI